MSLLISDPESGSHSRLVLGGTPPEPVDVWNDLPVVPRRLVRLNHLISRTRDPGRLPSFLSWLQEWLGAPFHLGLPDFLDRPAGLKRVGLVAELSLPGMGTRLGVGVETPLAHAVIDRLLSFDRPFAETRLQLSPVEWGIWTFVFVKAIDQFKADVSPSASPEIRLDRVGPDPFNPDRLGKIVTICWAVTLGTVTGTIRLWLPESVIASGGQSSAIPHQLPDPSRIASLIGGRIDRPVDTPAPPIAARLRELSSLWPARAGTVYLARGLKGLRVGGVIPISGGGAEPSGRVELSLDLAESGDRYRILALPGDLPGGRSLTLISTVQQLGPGPRENLRMSSKKDASSPAPPASALPVTLTVELGRINLSLSRLADLKPGDVVELNRHSREPVELTSNGRVVARGELIKIDTELGVRVTNVLL